MGLANPVLISDYTLRLSVIALTDLANLLLSELAATTASTALRLHVVHVVLMGAAPQVVVSVTQLVVAEVQDFLTVDATEAPVEPGVDPTVDVALLAAPRGPTAIDRAVAVC